MKKMNNIQKNFIILSLFLLPLISFSDTNSYIQCYYSPQDNCEAVWTNLINQATNHIYISCFGMTNKRIANALINQHNKGIVVKVCMDNVQSTDHGNQVSNLRTNGIEVVIKPSVFLEHNKMVSIDKNSGIVGSYNLSYAAESQDNSLVLFINQPNFVSTIEQAFTNIYYRDGGTNINSK